LVAHITAVLVAQCICTRNPLQRVVGCSVYHTIARADSRPVWTDSWLATVAQRGAVQALQAKLARVKHVDAMA
jgi:hypothetical protein